MQATNGTNGSVTLNGYTITAGASPASSPDKAPDTDMLMTHSNRGLLGLTEQHTPDELPHVVSEPQSNTALLGLIEQHKPDELHHLVSEPHSNRELLGLTEQHTAEKLPKMVSEPTGHRQRLVIWTSNGGWCLRGAIKAEWTQLHHMLGIMAQKLDSVVQWLKNCDVLHRSFEDRLYVLQSWGQQTLDVSFNNTQQDQVAHVFRASQEFLCKAHAKLVARGFVATYNRSTVYAKVVAIKQKLVHQMHSKLAQLPVRVHGLQWRMLAADSGVDIDVTVNVPAGQNASAAQNSIQGPGFAPALQQSLSAQGRLSDLISWPVPMLAADSGVDIDVTVNLPAGQNASAAQSSIQGPGFAPASVRAAQQSAEAAFWLSACYWS